MSLEGEQALLRIHLSNFARWHTGPLYEAIVEKARREHLSGATVLAGVFGFVGHGPVLGLHPHALQVERPVVVEIVDREDALRSFLQHIEPMLGGQGTLVTLERALVVHHRSGDAKR